MHGIPRRPFVHVNPPATRVTRFSNHLHLSRLLLAGDVGELQVGGKALLELLGLVVVLENQGVEVLLAADLELDVVGLLVLLDPGGGSVLPAADLDELLNVGDLLRHLGGSSRWDGLNR
jgi:hypothetical protein